MALLDAAHASVPRGLTVVAATLASADDIMHNRARANDPRPTSPALPQQGSS
jgi:hypothetical protein